jgi:hypothetical protein
MTRILVALGVTALALTTTVQSASAGTTNRSPDRRVTRILASIAAQESHGWRQNALPPEVLEGELARGERIVVSCWPVSRLGVRAARRAGYRSRLVGSFTREPLNGYDDDHVMLEVRLRRGWTVFDLDGNRRAPAGVGVSELVREPRWRIIAHDPLYDEADVAASEYPDYERAAFADLDAWYSRILGVPLIFAGGSFWFHDARDRSRGLSFGFQWASGDYWRRLKD